MCDLTAATPAHHNTALPSTTPPGRAGAHRSLLSGFLICARGAVGGLTVLPDDNDFVTAARHLPDLSERRVLDRH
ncbi:hypothetical protein Ait01nite_060640 [Actinoplanes italicus]|nr:hypothetical protein Ait01nite_060640 [Actinoplanes italicus]